MSTRIQIIILAALILVFALMIFHINKKKLDFKFCLPWMLFILVCIILTCFPVILDRVAWLVGIASPMNMLFYMRLLHCIVYNICTDCGNKQTFSDHHTFDTKSSNS